MEYKSESVLLSKILDYLGYSHNVVKIRQQFFNNSHNSDGISEELLTGSKSEGLTAYFENDFDCMIIPYRVICASDPNKYLEIREKVLVFYIDRAHTSPGYTRLHFQCPCNGFDNEVKYLNTYAYLSSYKWKQPVYKIPESSQTVSIHGPAIRSACRLNAEHTIDFDVVSGFICDCPEILHSWLNRARFHDWPSAEMIETIAAMEAHAVPVGFKGSQYESIEWRICFTKAENKLIQNLNDCQMKLLVLLKWIAKSELKPISKEITSYLMKNVVLWLVELSPADIFVENNLILTLKGALRFIKLCLIKNNLPSYMIMERNLLANRVNFRRRSRLCMKLDLLQSEGPSLVLRCDKVKLACNIMNISPGTLRMYCQNRQIFELLFMEWIGKVDNRNIGMILLFLDIIFPEGLDPRILDMNDQEVSQLCINRMFAFLS